MSDYLFFIFGISTHWLGVLKSAIILNLFSKKSSLLAYYSHSFNNFIVSEGVSGAKIDGFREMHTSLRRGIE